MEQVFKKSEQDRYPQKISANQLITVDDLLQFKRQLLDELLVAFRSQSPAVSKRWMKSHEVRKLLKISPGTLQTLKSSVLSLTRKLVAYIFTTTKTFKRCCSRVRLIAKRFKVQCGINSTCCNNSILKKCDV